MITVFTPTYNRVETLKRVYQSLLRQTCKDFEWVVVDDGSLDSTEAYLREIADEGLIAMRHYTQRNSGKMQAYNLGLQQSRGDYFFCLDSDDYLTDDAISKINSTIKRIHTSKVFGVIGLKRYINGALVGSTFPKKLEYTTLQNLYNKHRFRGDAFLVYKTSIASKHPFPKIEGEKFIPEAYIYDQLDQLGELIIMDEAVYVCEYLDDGYSKNFKNILQNNPKGFMLYNSQRMQLATTAIAALKAAINYNIAAHINKKEKFLTSLELKHRILCIAFYPLALLVYYFLRRD